MDFVDVVRGIHKDRGISGVPETLLALDPGHTTGWAAFSGVNLIDQGEVNTIEIAHATAEFGHLLDTIEPDIIVLEDYRIYKWKQKQHVGSDMLTTRVIGCIETLAVMQFRPLFKQSAQVAKNFCTDKKLKEWGYWVEGQRHARDAIRHGCYFLIFGPNKKAHRDIYKDTTTNPV